MSNYIEYKNRVAFHPGYYIKEVVSTSGLTQEDFAKRLDTTPKNLSLLIRGEQSLSLDLAMKLSRLLGTSVKYWLNLQNAYDVMIAEFKSDEELELERRVFDFFKYKYFVENFELPEFPRKIDEQIVSLRTFLNVSSLNVLTKEDLTVSFRGSKGILTEANIAKANTMVQIAINATLCVDMPNFNKHKLGNAINRILKLTSEHNDFFELIRTELKESGVNLVILPNIPGSKINGATKKLGEKMMIMVNDRNSYSDTFWFTLFHELGHIINGDYGISFEEEGTKESLANKYAEDMLIPAKDYANFLSRNQYDVNSIVEFASSIERDPGIVLGRLQNDGYIPFGDWRYRKLRHKYHL